jgi:protein O-mannosyl-transferase
MGKASRTTKRPTQSRTEEPRPEGLEQRDVKRFLRKKVLHSLLILAIALIAYSNTFYSPFQFDDMTFAENQLVRNLDNFISSTKGYNYNPSRFVGYLTFALNY